MSFLCSLAGDYSALTPAEGNGELELWGGLEGTVNRVGDHYFTQLDRNGHDTRPDDLDRFTSLGIRALRYPILWERTAPDGLERADWRWADERLARLRTLGLTPIVGLCHHGSGPRSTSLIEPTFAEGLAAYARAVAERYPWVEWYTPVNEPLTTARFSGLYGHWYPHGRDMQTFTRALLNECRATVLAMRAVRKVNPRAQLAQTEDLGKVYSTPALAYRAAHENERRWVSFDLLCGRLRPGMEMWRALREGGASEAELWWFIENAILPDVLGINTYITSERFLDERLERYPVWSHGGDGWRAYADVQAAHVRAEGVAGPYTLLRETWERYGLPVAITEAHLGGPREEQLRWLLERWQAAQRLRAEGANVRAVTVWSLLGAFDWNSLVTREDNFYESGVYDVRAPQPRPTALAGLMRYLAAGRAPAHPTLATQGWWLRPQRLLYPPVATGGDGTATTAPQGDEDAQPLVILGATGTLGQTFARVCEQRGLPYRLLSRRELDIADPRAVARMLRRYRPWAVINAAGYVRVDDAEREREQCWRENVDGPVTLARACARAGCQLMTFSSDLIFDGAKGAPYTESDPGAPLNTYGRAKAEAETRVLEAAPDAFVIRTSAFFGPWDMRNHVTLALRALANNQPFVAAEDEIVSPTYTPDLAHTCLDLLVDGDGGVWHLANAGAVSWADLARQAAERAGLDARNVVAQPRRLLGRAAARPPYSALGSERAWLLPTLDDALGRYLEECDARQTRWGEGDISA